MNRNIKIAKELVKLAKMMVGASYKLPRDYDFVNSGVFVSKVVVYQSDYQIGGKYQWSLHKKSEKSFTPYDCIVIYTYGSNYESKKKLIENKETLKGLGMRDSFSLSKSNINASFDAMFVGDILSDNAEAAVKKVADAVQVILGEEPVKNA